MQEINTGYEKDVCIFDCRHESSLVQKRVLFYGALYKELGICHYPDCEGYVTMI